MHKTLSTLTRIIIMGLYEYEKHKRSMQAKTSCLLLEGGQGSDCHGGYSIHFFFIGPSLLTINKQYSS